MGLIVGRGVRAPREPWADGSPFSELVLHPGKAGGSVLDIRRDLVVAQVGEDLIAFDHFCLGRCRMR